MYTSIRMVFYLKRKDVEDVRASFRVRFLIDRMIFNIQVSCLYDKRDLDNNGR